MPWVAAALAFGAFLQFAARSGLAPTSAGAQPAEAGPQPTGRATRPMVLVPAVALLAAGLVMTFAGVRMLRSDPGSHWLPTTIAGALLAAAVIEGWRRAVLRRPDPLWAAVEARPSLGGTEPQISIGLWVLAGGSLLLAAWRVFAPPSAGQLGLWLCLVVISLTLTLLTRARLMDRLRQADWRFWLAMAIPTALAAVTMLYRLRELPVALHFDHVYYALSALDLVEGRFDDPWEFGFVPGPLVGLVPPMIGLLLAGPGELGFRLGSALFGITGVVAVGILGRAYRDRRTGFFAALLLAGSVPFIHFSRTGANGDAATAATWTLAFFALALKSGHPRWWILTGAASGFSFYLWPGARVGMAACVIGGLILAARAPRLALSRWRGPAAMMIVFSLWAAPLVPLWIDDGASLFPRAEESLEVFKPSTGIRAERLAASFGRPLVRSAGWFYTLPDSSTHGTITPGCSEIEATLLTVGLVILLVEGFSLNVVLAVFLFLVMLVLGAFGADPPWYTRLIPSMPVAALLMSRTVVGSLDLFGGSRRGPRAFLLAATAAALVYLGPVVNFTTYARAERDGGTVPILDTMTIVGRTLRDLGPGFHHHLVITDNTEWSCDGARRNGLFGILLPYIWDLHVSEIRRLDTALPLPTHEPATLVLQIDRIHKDLTTLRRFYPELEFEILEDRTGQDRAGLVIIDAEVAANPRPRRDGDRSDD
jgi:hypothetical protein